MATIKDTCPGCGTTLKGGECPECGFDATEVDIY